MLICKKRKELYISNKKQTLDLGKDDIKKLLISLSLPAITSQIVNVLYNIIDRVYIGHIPDVGAIALTGVGVCFPIVMLISAFAALFSFGAAPRASIFLGKKDIETAEKTLGNSFTLLVISSIILTFLVLVFHKPMLYLFGASSNTIGYASRYIKIYAIGTIFVELTLGLNAFISVQGFSKVAMTTVIIGAMTNIILDPIFIYLFNMGVAGAALATIISQALSAAFALKFMLGERTKLSIKKENLFLNKNIAIPAISLGLAPFIMQATESILMLCFNSQLLRFGGDLAVGTMTITSSLMQFVLLPIQGLTQGGQAILSYNYGAGNIKRVKDAFKLQTLSSVIFSGIFWLLLQLVPKFFAGFFTSDPLLLKEASWAIRVYFAVVILFGIQISCQQTFIAFGDAKTSSFLAVFRKIIVLIPLIYILPSFIDKKVFAVFLAEPVADFIAVVTTTILFKHKLKVVEEDLSVSHNSKYQPYT